MKLTLHEVVDTLALLAMLVTLLWVIRMDLQQCVYNKDIYERLDRIEKTLLWRADDARSSDGND